MKSKNLNSVTILVEGGLMIAVAVVLSYIKVWQMPQGGSLNLTCLPLMVFAYRRGFIKGTVAALAFGVLKFILDPYHVIHPVSILFDYILSYGLAGIVGIKFLKNNITSEINSVIYVLIRFVLAVLSGVIVFASYANGQNVWVYSIGYNSYVLIEGIIVIICFSILKRSVLDKIKL